VKLPLPRVYKVLVAKLDDGYLSGDELLAVGVISRSNLAFYSTHKVIAVTLINRFRSAREDTNAV